MKCAKAPSKKAINRDTSLRYLYRILSREATLDYERHLDIAALGYDYRVSHPT